MSYQLKEIKIRTDNSKEGMEKINEMWRDIVGGKLPLMYDSEGNFLQGLSPVSRYSDYEAEEKGAYDLTVFTVTAEFFGEMERQAGQGKYRKYDFDGADISEAADRAWSQVWADKEAGLLARAFTEDFESTVPKEYTKDGRAHCYLYIAVKPGTTNMK